MIVSAYGASLTVALQQDNGVSFNIDDLVVEVTFNQDDRKQSVGMTLNTTFEGVPIGAYRITGIETPDGNDVSFDQPDNDECTRNILQDAQDELLSSNGYRN